MAERDIPPLYVPVAVILLSALVIIGSIVGDGQPGVRTAALVIGGVIAVGLVLHMVRSARGGKGSR